MDGMPMRARDNPFREALGRRCALVGPEGSGKTTLLEEFERRLAGQGFGTRMVRIDNTGDREPLREARAEARPDEVILIDGADALGRVVWRRTERRLRRAAGLLVTSHGPGLLPTLHECSTWPELLDEIVAELSPARKEELLARTRALYDRHGGNLRAALRDLYEICAAMDE
jgi:predicted ATPase